MSIRTRYGATDDLIPEVRAALAKATPYGLSGPKSEASYHLFANAPAWLEALCDEVERLRRESAHEREITDKAIARADRAEAAVERVRELADWHETKADKARRFPGEEVAIMEKAARVHEDAARRLRAALDEVSR